MSEKALERQIHLGVTLAKRLVIGALSGCWFWSGAGSSHGYGVITYQRKHHATHRLAYELWRGPIPAGMLVCHRCDNPSCCNPEHLFLGTPKENTGDMVKKGRLRFEGYTKQSMSELIARGKKAGQKLLPDDVRDIRRRVAAGGDRKAICRQYGIRNTCISNIVTRRTWPNL